jgi:hypothetical protein
MHRQVCVYIHGVGVEVFTLPSRQRELKNEWIYGVNTVDDSRISIYSSSTSSASNSLDNCRESKGSIRRIIQY